jgi:RHS repeat-associated protein
MTYDTRGNVSTKTDGNGNTIVYRYDGENRLISVTDPLGNSTRYTYDANGNLIAQTDGNGSTTTYQYNAANLLRSKTEPSDAKRTGKSERYTYTANGRMATKIDRNGVTTAYTYDIFGRLLTEDAGGQVQSYTYDANSNMLTMTDATGTTTRTYDALNRNTGKEVPAIGLSTYEYDLLSENPGEHAERTTDPKGNVTLKTFDKVGRLSKITLDNDITEYDYYRNGRQFRVTYPDGTTETYAYDKVNRITNLVNAKEGGSVLSSYQYTYDGAGNQLTKYEAKGTTTYTYDSLNRLSAVEEPDGKKTSYTYDGAGNRKTEQVEKGLVSATTVYYYSAQNRLTATLSSNGTKTVYLYDYNGNLLSKSTSKMKMISVDELTKEDLPNFDLIIRRESTQGTGSDNFTTYQYDNYNRLINTKSANTSATYGYNAQGYRVEKQVNNKTIRYLYEADKVVLETDESNNLTAYQVYGAALIYRSTSADSELGAQSYYYLYNAHGDVTALMNSEGDVAITYDYDAFGNIISQTGAADNAIKYAGYQHDEESGLYYLNARYYDSVTARFITEDTYTGKRNDPLSLNLYTYCANNPIIYDDPSGHSYFNGKEWVSSIPNTTKSNSGKTGGTSKSGSDSGKTSNTVSQAKSCTAVEIAKDKAKKAAKEIEQKNPHKPSNDVDVKDKKADTVKQDKLKTAEKVIAYIGGSFIPGVDSAIDFAEMVSDLDNINTATNFFEGAESVVNLVIDTAAFVIPVVDGPINSIGKVYDITRPSLNAVDTVKGASNSINFKNVDDLPSNVQSSYNNYDKSGWKGNVQGQSAGTKAGGSYQNSNGALPTTDTAGNPITYKEFDVNNKLPNAGRDTERFITGTDGSIYYTDSHYGDIQSPSGLPSFVKVK